MAVPQQAALILQSFLRILDPALRKYCDKIRAQNVIQASSSQEPTLSPVSSKEAASLPIGRMTFDFLSESDPPLHSLERCVLSFAPGFESATS